MIEDKIFGWDLDHTLGNFYPIAISKRTLSPEYDEELSRTCLRKGITEFLEKLCNQNCRNVIMTQGTTAYAHEVLVSTGLDRYFVEIFDGEEINVGRGKLIKPLIKKIGLTDEEARKQILITGDLRDDQPADISGVVFIFHPGGYRYGADILHTTFSLLDDLGEGNFSNGFSSLYQRAHSLQSLPLSSRFYKINDSAKLLLDQQTTVYSEAIKGAGGTVNVPTLRIL